MNEIRGQKPEKTAGEGGQVDAIVMRTPFEPSGLVEVIYIGVDKLSAKKMAQVRYKENHPHGYKKGELGWYFADELYPA